MKRRDIRFGLAVVALLCLTNVFAQALPVAERGALNTRDALATVEANRPKLIARMDVRTKSVTAARFGCVPRSAQYRAKASSRPVAYPSVA